MAKFRAEDVVLFRDLTYTTYHGYLSEGSLGVVAKTQIDNEPMICVSFGDSFLECFFTMN